jgi:DNA-binding transcriptional ArsR family regulator
MPAAEINTSTESFCARRLKVLADPTRLAILRILLEQPKRVGELNALLKIEQSLLSHHLKILRQAKLVASERDGKAILCKVASGVAYQNDKGINIGCCVLSF